MPRMRIVLASGLLLTLVPVLGSPAHRVQAAPGIGIAQTDFSQVTPANAMFFAALQATTADQQPNLATLTTEDHVTAGLPGTHAGGHGR